MSYTVSVHFTLFGKENIKTDFTAGAKVPEDTAPKGHTMSLYEGKVIWEEQSGETNQIGAGTPIEIDVQWLRNKFEKSGNGGTTTQLENSFTIKTNYVLKLTTIPGLNIHLDKPVFISFNRLTVGKGNTYYYEAPAEQGRTGENAAAAKLHVCEKFDFEMTAKMPGEDAVKINRSTFISPKPSLALVNDGNNNISATKDGVIWFKTDKHLGPIHLIALGVKWENGSVGVLINASVSMAGLRFNVMGLEAKVKPGSMFTAWPKFDLEGLEFDFDSDLLVIGASLLKQQVKSQTQYIGAALIDFKKSGLIIYGVGAYAKVRGHDSLFLYFGLNKALGGPAFFFVEGLSLGVGYNRHLQVKFEQVQDFPLIQLAFKDPEKVNLLDLSQQLLPYIPPALGNSFLMAGVRFNSFKIIQSFALFAFKLTGKFSVRLFGLSRLRLNKPVDQSTQIGNESSEQIVFIEIKLKGDFEPSAGFVKIDGAITSNSYIINKNIHLSGGFAFYSWWKNASDGGKAGDFVMTVGGYHPKFKPPSYYPTVPRVALDWKVSDDFQIHGELFYALTPHAIMAGWDARALYHSGNIRANFEAGMHFLIQWAPFHYDIDFYAHLHLEYHLRMHIKWVGSVNKTLNLSAGVDLHIYGPDFGANGHAYLKVKISVVHVKLSIGLHIGAAKKAPQPLKWEQFQSQLLSGKSGGSQLSAAAEQVDKNRISFQVSEGLIQQIDKPPPPPPVPPPVPVPQPIKDTCFVYPYILVLNPKAIQCEIETVAPLTAIQLHNKVTHQMQNDALYIGPMDASINKSILSITVSKRQGDGTWQETDDLKLVESGGKNGAAGHKSMPAALWAKSSTAINPKTTIIKALSKATLVLSAVPQPGQTVSISMKALEYERVSVDNPEPSTSGSFQYEALNDVLHLADFPALNTSIYQVLENEASHNLVPPLVLY